MSMAFGSKLQLEPGSWMEMIYDIGIGIAVGAHHSIYIVTRWWHSHFIQPILQSLGETDKSYLVNKKSKKLKVVAVGYGRTGTYSLKLALDELGYPTLHTQHLYEYQNVIDMWTNEIFLPSIRDEKASMGLPDFQVLLDEGFSATADLPMALYYEEILNEFPDCKFILTTRANSEEWFRSWDMLTKSITETTNLGGFVFSNVRQYSYYLRWLFAVVNKDNSYLTRPFPLPHQNQVVAMQSYEDHNRHVREFIPPNQLLEYNVKEGWGPLCSFLEIEDCPATSFPKTNSARSIQIQAMSAFYTPIIAVLCVLVYAFSKIFKKSTGLTVGQWANWKSKELNLTLRKTMLGEKIHMDGTSCVSKKV